jgi:hypothetical protein
MGFSIVMTFRLAPYDERICHKDERLFSGKTPRSSRHLVFINPQTLASENDVGGKAGEQYRRQSMTDRPV